MRLKVLSPTFSTNQILRQELISLNSGLDIIFNDSGKRLSDTEISQFLMDADLAIVGLEKIDDKTIENCSRMKLISKFGVGIDNIDFHALEKKKIELRWTPGLNKRSVSEMTLCFMISLMRNLYTTSLLLKNGTWKKDGGSLLSGKTIGIIGIGNIGKDLVQLLRPFGCKILVNDIENYKEFIFENDLIVADKETIYKQADVITIHVPKTPLTTNLITIKELRMMKKSSFIINTARGGIINETDLYQALKNKIIAGAAVDAYLEEPPSDLDFLQLENLFCTPHVGGNAKEAVLAMGRSAIHHVNEFINVQ